MDEGFNWFLIIIVLVISIVVSLANIYIVVYYQHPDDKNQAWLPKFVVWLGLTTAIISVLMFPLDVANRNACDEHLALSSCDLTLPMRELWYTVYILNLILVYFVIPFSLFYYEAGSDRTMTRRILSALCWVISTAIVLGLILGITYAIFGYVEYPTQKLSSGMTSIESLTTDMNIDFEECILPDYSTTETNSSSSSSSSSTGDDVEFKGTECDAKSGSVETEEWEIRTSFAVYIIALSSLIGWITFIGFGGIGISALPMDLISSYYSRPRATITKSEYIKEATFVAQKAREIKELGEALKKEERANGRTRNWRRNFKELDKQLILLENLNGDLEQKFPQGDDADTKWVLYQMKFIGKLILGILGVIVSTLWVIHIILYLLSDPPVSSFLNEVFIELDDVFPLFGTASFAFFCLYLIAATIKGHMKMGLNIAFLDLYPIRPGATLMNSMLVNTALSLLSSTAVIQFCAQSFAVYARDTAIQEIFGTDISNLRGIEYLYKKNVFLYCLLAFIGLGILIILIKAPVEKYNKKSKESVYAA